MIGQPYAWAINIERFASVTASHEDTTWAADRIAPAFKVRFRDLVVAPALQD